MGATDGLPDNAWRTESSTGTWFYVDLGVPTSIQSIVTTLYVDEQFASAPRTYFITSNDLKTWQIVIDEVNQKNASGRGMPRTLTLPQNMTVRYVGLYASDWGGGWADMTQFSVLTQPIPEAGVVWPTVLTFGIGFILVSGGLWFGMRLFPKAR